MTYDAQTGGTMISLGAHFRGPELDGSRFRHLIIAAMTAVERSCGRFLEPNDSSREISRPDSDPSFELGSSPAVNVVFYVPGSLGDFDIPEIEASRLYRKDKLVLVAVPVTRDEVASGGSVDFVTEALHEANRIAAETFSRKTTETFPLAQADAIVTQVRQSLIDQGF